MPFTPVKTPKVVKSLFPNYVWNVDTLKKDIYLTFDDGPTPEITHWTLNTLTKYNAKATFFCIGANIEKHPSIFQDILEEGHSIGNHTQQHLKGWKTNTEAYLKDIEKAQKVIKSKILNSQLRIQNLFRPPYGKITPKQGKLLLEKGYNIIMWDVLSYDWDKTVSREDCLTNVISKTQNGSIVVFHDSIKASKNMQYVLPKVLKHYTEAGYRFKSLNTF
ncbi:polysaccharide deacetylase family protein [Hyunsoonleella pacifica]|uniref:Polysaccharide deacetylase family protein n=1 Tax=Hyunsoonleella pacifica TaxID=1080224 RepID=A0A4Q9FS88_9FLAO|nr:polysaccharide deacetylase family protein [Hyunsoonleella pacifica]TBN16494.1 polysaccharide deacetylase family protein [Hyunsoonleella pacifica]GGD18901.1 polysaccharide deacetylase [Hyunsoonleella pacifica]